MHSTESSDRPLASVISIHARRAQRREHRHYIDQGARVAWDESGYVFAEPQEAERPYGRHAQVDDRDLPGA